MWRGFVAPLKQLKVYIKIVKQQLGVKRPLGGVKVLWFLLFNDKKMKREGGTGETLHDWVGSLEKGWDSLGVSYGGSQAVGELRSKQILIMEKKKKASTGPC